MNLHASFTRPDYNGRNFSHLPATIEYWLTGIGAPAFAPDVMDEYARQYDLVILFFIDSFGWELFERYADHSPFLQHLKRGGRVSKITSQFPSTTAAHVTCIHTGLPVAKSGVFEWQYYEPQLDAVITPLLFSYAGTLRRDTLKPTGIEPTRLYPSQSLYASLAAHGVRSYAFGSREFTPSTYSNIVMRGARIEPYRTLTESFVNLTTLAAKVDAPAYLFFYFGNVDTMCHEYGPNSLQTHAEVDALLHALDKWFLPFTHNLDKRALFVMTADHGHMSVSPDNTRYLNLDPALKGIVSLLRTDASGNILVPAGSPRDPFLYVREEALDEAYTLLSKGLEGYADVVKTCDLLDEGYFGKLPVCADLLGRLGNLVVLPHPHNTVWWYEQDKYMQRYFGHHGGLTRTEMEIPLALLESVNGCELKVVSGGTLPTIVLILHKGA